MTNLRSTSQFFPQFSKEGKDFEAVADIEHHQAFKKPRVTKVWSDSKKWLYYKTRLCNNFKWGHCHYGEACLYAHGIEEIRSSSKTEKGMLSRTVYAQYRICGELPLCRMFLNEGKCSYGERCRFRHVTARSIRDESVITVSGDGSGQFGCKRSVSLDVDTNGESRGRDLRHQSSVAVGKGMLSDTRMASGSFTHGHAVLRKRSGYIAVETKHWKTSITSREVQVTDGNFNWNELEKRSRIYADWIEEIPLVHREVECAEF